MNLRNLIKWSALFLALVAYKQSEATEISIQPEMLTPQQEIFLAANQYR